MTQTIAMQNTITATLTIIILILTLMSLRIILKTLLPQMMTMKSHMMNMKSIMTTAGKTAHIYVDPPGLYGKIAALL